MPASSLLTGSKVRILAPMSVVLFRFTEFLDQVMEVVLMLVFFWVHVSSSLCPTIIPLGELVLMLIRSVAMEIIIAWFCYYVCSTIKGRLFSICTQAYENCTESYVILAITHLGIRRMSCLSHL